MKIFTSAQRLLLDRNYDVTVYLFNIQGHLSEDCAANKKRLQEKKSKALIEVIQEFEPPQLEADTLVVDGLFGSGLNKPLAGGFASLVKYINASPSKVVSIDIPSGLMTEDNTYNVRANIIRADMTLTLQHQKLSFLFAENQQFIGQLKVLDIRLSKEGTDKIDANYTLLEEGDIRQRLLPRDPFAHKGKMGNALIIAGSYGMGGAAVLATKACLRIGAGRVTTHTPKRNYMIMQISVPEPLSQRPSILRTSRLWVSVPDWVPANRLPSPSSPSCDAPSVRWWLMPMPSISSPTIGHGSNSCQRVSS